MMIVRLTKVSSTSGVIFRRLVLVPRREGVCPASTRRVVVVILSRPLDPIGPYVFIIRVFVTSGVFLLRPPCTASQKPFSSPTFFVEPYPPPERRPGRQDKTHINEKDVWSASHKEAKPFFPSVATGYS